MMAARLLPRFRRAERALEAWRIREGWCRSTIESYQLDRLNSVWHQAIAHVPYYRGLACRDSLPPNFSSLQEFRDSVPILSKAIVRDRPEMFLSDRPEPGAWRMTGGSTGSVGRFYESHTAHREILHAKYRFLDSWGVSIFDRSAYLWGHEHAVPYGLRGAVEHLRSATEDYLRNRLKLSAYDLAPLALREHLRRIERFRPRWLYGYSTAVSMLAQEAMVCDFACDALNVVVLTSEPAHPSVVDTVRRGFGVPVVSEYGATECGFIAAEGRDGQLRVREDIVLLETPRDEDGYLGLVLTVLNNPSFPLIRYAIEDLTDEAIVRPDRGFAILSSICGRSDDLVVTARGDLVHPARFDGVFECEACMSVRRYRIHQQADGSLAVTIELDDRGAPPNLRRLRREFESLLHGSPVQVTVVETIAQTPAGKHRTITSDMSPDGAARASRQLKLADAR